MKQFTSLLTPAELREFHILKDQLFQGHSFVCFSDSEENSPEHKRYNELLAKLMQDRAKGIHKPDVFVHKFNRNILCEIHQSTKKGYKVLQAVVVGKKTQFTTQYFTSMDFADNGGIWKRII